MTTTAETLYLLRLSIGTAALYSAINEIQLRCLNSILKNATVLQSNNEL